ncbi:MAG: hypothetical protein DHS20C11_18980 [Lysobacteraceae bacterium]|nr:MAG: hypothetical protein DHS20C11_18980 [Xanthomonadaceae bacterium]
MERSSGEVAFRFADRCEKGCKARRPERGIRPKNGPKLKARCYGSSSDCSGNGRLARTVLDATLHGITLGQARE